MRITLVVSILALFSQLTYAIDQSAVNAAINSIKQKAAAGQNVQSDIADLTNSLKADAKSLVVSNQMHLSVVDKSGAVSLYVPFPSTTTVIANDPNVENHAKAAIAAHPASKAVHNMDNLDAAVSLGGGGKKKPKADTTTTESAAAPSPAPTDTTSTSSGGIGGFISSAISTVVGLVGSIL